MLVVVMVFIVPVSEWTCDEKQPIREFCSDNVTPLYITQRKSIGVCETLDNVMK